MSSIESKLDTSLPPVKRALLALEEMRAKLDRAEQRSREAVAIVGLSCRVPGGDSPAAFWKLLHDGGEATREIPADRWDIDAYYDADPDRRGKSPAAGARSLIASINSTRIFLEFRRARRIVSIRSSGCCSKSPGSPLRMQVSCRRRWPAAGRAFSSASGRTTTRTRSTRQRRDSICIRLPAADAIRHQGGFHTFLICVGRASRWIRRARRRWSRSHLACRQSAQSARATSRCAGGVNVILMPEFRCVHSNSGHAVAGWALQDV